MSNSHLLRESAPLGNTEIGEADTYQEVEINEPLRESSPIIARSLKMYYVSASIYLACNIVAFFDGSYSGYITSYAVSVSLITLIGIGFLAVYLFSKERYTVQKRRILHSVARIMLFAGSMFYIFGYDLEGYTVPHYWKVYQSFLVMIPFTEYDRLLYFLTYSSFATVILSIIGTCVSGATTSATVFAWGSVLMLFITCLGIGKYSGSKKFISYEMLYNCDKLSHRSLREDWTAVNGMLRENRCKILYS